MISIQYSAPANHHVYAFGWLSDDCNMEIMYFAVHCPVSVLSLEPVLNIAVFIMYHLILGML
jgi:hypothetical protein